MSSLHAYRIHRTIRDGGSSTVAVVIILVGLVVFLVPIVGIPGGIIIMIIGGCLGRRYRKQVICSHCGNEVLPTSVICPHCRARLIASRGSSGTALKWAFLGLLITALVFSLVFLWLKSHAQ